MSLTLLAAVLITSVVWVQVARATIRHPLDGVALVLYFTAIQLILRPLVLALGLDTPFPTDVFAVRDVEGPMFRTLFLISVWLLAFLAGVRFLGPVSAAVSRAIPTPRHELTIHQLSTVALAVTALATLATGYAWSRYGGPFGLLEASKGTRTVTGRPLRVFPFLGAFVGVALTLRARWSGRGQARSVLLGALVAVLNIGYSFSWGARDSAVYAVVSLALGLALFPTRRWQSAIPNGWRWVFHRRQLRYLALGLCFAVSVGFFLRTQRDILLSGDLNVALQDESIARQLAVGMNNTMFDALVLVVDDWPEVYDYRGGADFGTAIVRAVPLAGGQNTGETPAVVVARTYDPSRVNGWPITALGDWYLNFGLLGVVIGGLLSGAGARAIQRATSHFVSDPFAWVILFAFVGRVYEMGVSPFLISRYPTLALPILVILVVVDEWARVGNTRRSGHRILAAPSMPEPRP